MSHGNLECGDLSPLRRFRHSRPKPPTSRVRRDAAVVCGNRRTPHWVALCLTAVYVFGCATAPKETAQQLFERTVKEFHLPSAEAHGAERDKLLTQAAAGYERLLRQYHDQPAWCAQATRSLGNVRAEQGRLDDAVKLYRQVSERYPQQEWEVLQAWKSAADLLWDAGRQDDARAFYRQITGRFDRDDAPAVVKTIARAAKAKL